MNKYIVTTTIQEPTLATLSYAQMQNWILIVVGDLKTPHESYHDMQNRVIYLSPYIQHALYPKLSDAIGWNTIQRRNLGFVFAYEHGADIVASVDDDNIPYENWGKDVRVGQEVEVDVWEHKEGFPLDPLEISAIHKELWHRGYPLEYVRHKSNVVYLGKEKKKILFQADLWNGDPDVDAICRVMYKPTGVFFNIKEPFTSHNYMPFNSQNTFIAREALPYYMVLPFVGRMDDIWGGYLAQHLLNTRPLFMPPTVYQERNKQSLQKNLEDEIYGYMTTVDFLNDIENYEKYLPEKTLKAYTEYRLTYVNPR